MGVMLDAAVSLPARPGRGPSRRGRRARRALAPAVVLAFAVLGLAGCGGGDDAADQAETSGGTELTAADARASDRAVKEGAVEVMEAVESCFRGSGDYGACRRRDQIGVTKPAVVPDDPGVSEATVSRATTTGYRILTVSLSGNRFAITRQGTRVIRSCVARTELGRSGGGCQDNGW